MLYVTNFFIRASRPIESRVISKLLYSALDSAWFLVSGSNAKKSTASRFRRFPSSMYSVFINSVILKAHILFVYAVCSYAKSAYAVLIIFPCLRNIFMLEPFLNCVLMYRPSLVSLCFSNTAQVLLFVWKILCLWRNHRQLIIVICLFLLPHFFLKCGLSSRCSPH